MVHLRHHQDFAIRRLYPADQNEICDHFRRLGAEARRARFCGTVSAESLTDYVQSIPHYDSLLYGAFAKGRLRGVVELRGDDQTGSTKTEAAFSVEPDWQNIGIGDALFERIIAIARTRGINSIELMCLRENSRMRHLAEKHNARLCIDQGVAKAVLHPKWQTPS